MSNARSAARARRRRSRVAGALLLVPVLAVANSPAWGTPAERTIDYLYIEANEGGSSGGHTALRFGGEIFHFQRADGALLRMQRDDPPTFAVHYALFDNRPIHETSIAVSADTYAMLHDTFTRRLLVQTAQLERLAALRADVDLFERLTSRSTGVTVRGAGFFMPDGFPVNQPEVDGCKALVDLRRRVAARYGDAFVADRITGLRSQLATWAPHAADVPVPELTRDAFPSFAPTASTELAEQLAGLTALEVLTAAPPLRAGTYRIADDQPPLSDEEHRHLASIGAALATQLVSLAASPRADFGYPLLLGMARLAAIEATLASGRLVVLDAFPSDAPVATLPKGADRTLFLDALTGLLQPAVDRARQELCAEDDFREADYTQLELTLNRALEVTQARRRGGKMRLEREPLLPAIAAQRAEIVAPPLPEAAARAQMTTAQVAATEYRSHLADLYGYNLFSRNCVSEIFDTVDAALAGGHGDDETAERESDQRLGGMVRTRGNLNFIPFISEAAVQHSYRAVESRTHPSYRQMRLAAMATGEPSWRVYLRESNTLTSSVYRAGARDSSFLFFTDDTVALRPFFGTVNLMVGVGDGLLGLVTWPVDAGARLQAGWRGALFSLPELAFFNIRKGSTAWFDADDLAAAASGW